MGIMNSNDYQRGYRDGYHDAKAGCDKNYSKSGMSAKYWLYGSNALKTYCEGYDEGYRIGMRNNS